MADPKYNYNGENGINELVLLLKNKIMTRVKKVEGKDLSTNDFTDEYKDKLDAIPDIDSTMDDTSDKLATSKAIGDYVKDKISKIETLTRIIVDALPTSDIKTNVIYMLKKRTTPTGNLYDEYMYINNAWELIGSSNVDLSGYVKAEEMHELTSAEVETLFNAAWGSDD